MSCSIPTAANPVHDRRTTSTHGWVSPESHPRNQAHPQLLNVLHELTGSLSHSEILQHARNFSSMNKVTRQLK